jgi:HD superfamily phosphohydrolase
MVYPGAVHNRFAHAIGATYLMTKAIQALRLKDVKISDEEYEGACLAILLHDVGHAPFSHTLEHTLLKGMGHEDLSIMIMELLNDEYDGKLTLAIAIFTNTYPRKFLHELVSSQLDVDRLDYLKRDSFYTGVTEGNINTERIISMFTVEDNNLVIEEKGIYSVEKFIVSRRLMYWQVYLHKTSLVADYILVGILKRAKELISENIEIVCSTPLKYFLSSKEIKSFDITVLHRFSEIDDYDIMMAIKQWMNHSDYILSKLSKSLIFRNLPKIKIQETKFSTEEINTIKKGMAGRLSLNDTNIDYFIKSGVVENQAYNLNHSSINILYKSGEIKDIINASDHLNLMALTKPVIKHFVYYPK